MKEGLHDNIDYETVYTKMKPRLMDELIFVFENEFNECVSSASNVRQLVNSVSISFVDT